MATVICVSRGELPIMLMQRFVYAFSLAGCLLFFVLYPFWFSFYLLVVILLLAPFDLLISLPGMLSKKIRLRAPKVLEQGAGGALVIETVSKKKYPARCIKAILKVSVEDYSARRRFVLSAEHGGRFEVSIDTSRSGATVFESKRIWAVSLVGLFCLPAKLNCRAHTLVLPPAIKPPHTVTLPRGVILRPKPGGGFSDEFDLRPFRDGDPMRGVHWKVSAKLDSLIIREPLIPQAHSRLVHAARWNGESERDLILGQLRWVSDYLLKWELPHFVKLGESGPVADVAKADDLYNYLFLLLGGDADAIPVPATLPVRFAWVFKVGAG